MNEGPFRMPSPAESRDAPAERSKPAEEPALKHKEESKQMNRSRHYSDEKSKKPLIIGGLVALVVVLILAVSGAVWALSGNGSVNGVGIDSGKYQAVFLTNGQVYFGKLHASNDDYVKLTDIFYLQSNQADTSTDSKNLQQANTSQNADVQLIKLGSELHGPTDEMIVNKDQLLFFENLKEDGKVAKSIGQYQSQNKK